MCEECVSGGGRGFFEWPHCKHVCVLFFSFVEDDLGHFEIDSGSGDIRTTWRFSQNSQTHYTFTVVAHDGGHTPLEERAVIHLQVTRIDSLLPW